MKSKEQKRAEAQQRQRAYNTYVDEEVAKRLDDKARLKSFYFQLSQAQQKRKHDTVAPILFTQKETDE